MNGPGPGQGAGGTSESGDTSVHSVDIHSLEWHIACLEKSKGWGGVSFYAPGTMVGIWEAVEKTWSIGMKRR